MIWLTSLVIGTVVIGVIFYRDKINNGLFRIASARGMVILNSISKFANKNSGIFALVVGLAALL